MNLDFGQGVPTYHQHEGDEFIQIFNILIAKL